MSRNYLTVAWRKLQQNRTFSIINVLGLAIGMATCLLISLYILDELRFDRFNIKADRIYRVNTDLKIGEAEHQLATVPDPFGPTFAHDFPQVERQVRFRNYGGYLVRKGAESLKEEGVVFVDSTLFDVFTLPLVAGNPRTALTEPNTVVITESIARKYFGTTQVLGKTLTFNRTEQDKITGVIRDIPTTSHFRFDFFRSMLSIDEAKQGNWLGFNFTTYLLLKKGTQPSSLVAQLRTFTDRYASPALQKWGGTDLKGFEKTGGYIRYSLMPLTDIHLRSDRISELAPNSDIRYVLMFGAMALFILLIACVNFMNLSTAQSAGRAKEVGMRKVLGSMHWQLIGQFLIESMLMSGLALVVAIGLGVVLLPYFNTLANKTIHLVAPDQLMLLPALLGFALLVGLLAGSYPAFFLARFQPIKVLKGAVQSGARKSRLRNGLVVFQFATSLVIIIGTFVIYAQLNFIRSQKVGFDKDQVLLIKDANALGTQVAAFRNEVGQLPGVVTGTTTGFFPVDGWGQNSEAFFPEGVKEAEKALKMEIWNVDADYLPTLGIKLTEGRNFSKQLSTDSSAILINEAAARLLGYRSPINHTIERKRSAKRTDTYTIIGVVKDFNFQSLRQSVGPLILHLDKSEQGIGFKLATRDVAGVVANIEAKWKTMAGGQPFSYSFLDESFDRMYRSEQRVGQVFVSFAALAILIACLGLFGLSAFTAERRTKEIGVRKVLGASTGSIVGLLSKDFLKLVLIAIGIASPVAWYAMNRWLQNFAYKIDIGWWIFVLAGLLTLAIALLTVSFQSIKAALVNPVKSLRSE
ncbi:FtsX-like permease family protein [Spirosoma sp. HMF4905]|uniref:FtsX-like permease family protein n=1 Tax=Spirosoma arboris TaxID=2682092 RepID=A0A7K1SJB2_9BACT|nr:FtsX-like permease family protein [Spirosoma arboris]